MPAIVDQQWRVCPAGIAPPCGHASGLRASWRIVPPTRAGSTAGEQLTASCHPASRVDIGRRGVGWSGWMAVDEQSYTHHDVSCVPIWIVPEEPDWVLFFFPLHRRLWLASQILFLSEKELKLCLNRLVGSLDAVRCSRSKPCNMAADL